MKRFVLAYFPGLDLTQQIVTIGNIGIPANVTGNDLPDFSPLFFHGYDESGNKVLCTIKNLEVPLVLSTANSVSIATVASDTIGGNCILLGGRPIRRPR